MKMFDLNEVQIVPTARHPINPVPNAVRCGVQEARRASCVPKARYRYTKSCVPQARSYPLCDYPPRTASCTGFPKYRASARRQYIYCNRSNVFIKKSVNLWSDFLRNAAQIIFTCLVYNMLRYEQIKRLGMN